MIRNRIIFIVSLIILTAQFVAFGAEFLLYVIGLLLVLAAALKLLLKRDCRNIGIDISSDAEGHVGDSIPIHISVKCRSNIYAASSIGLTLAIDNAMTEGSRREKVRLKINDNGGTYTAKLPLKSCGHISVKCTDIFMSDVFRLFRGTVYDECDTHITVYPRDVSIRLVVSGNTVGSSRTDGLVQNRKGQDQSEIYDFREYIPGDDVRTIHWKLSEKLDKLIAKEASDTPHYDVAVLPDLGLEGADGTVSREEMNAAAGFFVSVGESLLANGIRFCAVIPTSDGMMLYEIGSRRELHRIIPEWLSFRVSMNVGDGFELFISERLEQYFSRLLIVTPGRFSRSLSELGSRVAVSIVSATETDKPVYTELGSLCSVSELPVDGGEDLRVVC